MSRTLVMCMNPRAMQPCLDSYAELDADVAWLTGYWEHQLPPVIAYLTHELDYDHFVLGSDDCIVSQAALDEVVDGLELGFPVVTGWCPLATGHYLANVTSEPLRRRVPVADAYVFMHVAELERAAAAQVPYRSTGFVGMALTGMSRDMWLRFPFETVPHPEHPSFGIASDFSLSMRLTDAGVPMRVATRGRVEHVKARWNEIDATPGRELLIGRVDAGVTLRSVERQPA